MSQTINDRLKIIIKNKFHGNAAALARAAGMKSAAGMSSYIGGSTPSKPGYDILAKIAKDLNIDGNWLLIGEGEMYRRQPTGTIISASDHSAASMHGDVVMPDFKSDQDTYLNQINTLRDLCNEKERTIQLLLKACEKKDIG